MRFEWDEAKRRSNLTRHGIDFADVSQLFEVPAMSWADDRYDYGERRLLRVGLLHGEVVVVVYTGTDHVIRLISARKATRDEEIQYFKEIWN